MARKKRPSRTKGSDAVQAEQAKRALEMHLCALRLNNVTEYKAWCLEHGFGTGIYKSRHQRHQECKFAVRQAADARRVAVRRQSRKPERSIEAILDASAPSEPFAGSPAQRVHAALLTLKDNRLARRALEELVRHIQSCSRLPFDRVMIPPLGTQPGNTFMGGLVALALHSRGWYRGVETWKPRSHNARRQFASLARHLFAEYDVPAFMDSAWFLGTTADARQQQRWFIHIAKGRNIRKADLPIPFTKRMAHHFLKAPADSTIYSALRWGQIHGMGGDARLADALRETRLVESFEEDEFWTSVLRFFIANPMLDTVHVGPIIDYLYDQRFRCREQFVAPGVCERQPPAQPNLSMKGRTADSLLAQVQRWHRQLSKESSSGLKWSPCGLKGFEFIEGSEEKQNMRRWQIQELTSARALNSEGRAMHHCVASYAGSCARGQTSIWSMTVDSYEGTRRVLTLEVRLNSKTICQARGRYNNRPTEKARNIMNRWAAQEGLTQATYV